MQPDFPAAVRYSSHFRGVLWAVRIRFHHLLQVEEPPAVAPMGSSDLVHHAILHGLDHVGRRVLDTRPQPLVPLALQTPGHFHEPRASLPPAPPGLAGSVPNLRVIKSRELEAQNGNALTCGNRIVIL